MQENRMFAQMLKAARTWLAHRDPAQIARNANVAFTKGMFQLDSLGKQVTVSYPGCEITPELDPWHQLLILHYLNLADGTSLTGQPITFAQQKDGMVRGGGFDRKAETAIRQQIGRGDPAALQKRCAALGGKEKSSGADYCVELPLFPMYPVTLNLWFADEEFPASGRLLLDSSAEHYLSVEDSVMAGELLLQRLMTNHILCQEK